MRLILIILLIGWAVISCTNIQKVTADKANSQELAVETNDSVVYELIVFDPKFESFLASQPYPKWYYSNEYYRNWNHRYCIEWNIRHSDPLRYGTFYETDIPYDSFVDYGIDFNFKLYQYFQFIDKEYGIVLIGRRGK